MGVQFSGHEEVGTFFLAVDPEGQNVVTAQWVYHWLINYHGRRAKAKPRLVARVLSQRPGDDFFVTFSPTPIASIKVIDGVANEVEWMLRDFDVDRALVRADLHCDIYERLTDGWMRY